MRVLIAVSGTEDERFFLRAAELAPLDRAERIILAHAIDPKPRGDLEFGRERFLTKRPLPPERALALSRAEEDQAHACLQYARHALITAGVPDVRIEEVILQGKPNETLRDLAEREHIDLLIVGARPGKSGPHSMGKTARFLVDHAPEAALLIR